MKVIAGLDIGKTNLRLGVFTPDLTCLETWSTSSEDVPLAQAELRQQLHQLARSYQVASAGVSIFGPLRTDPSRSDFGAIIESSEPSWSQVNIPALVQTACRCPVFFDYDVNAGALAEAILGAAAGVNSFVYLSVGTGIGCAYYRGGLVAGYAPQAGHMFLPRQAGDQSFAGSCRFHGGCLQGLASGRAIAARWGRPAEQLPESHPAWDMEARYLATACANLVYSFSPQKIVLGSSVGVAGGLVEKVNALLPMLLNGFLEPELRESYAQQPPVLKAALAHHSSLLGAALLAHRENGLKLL